MENQSSVLITLAVLSVAGMILTGYIGMYLGRHSRPKEEEDLSNLDEPPKYHIMLANRVTPPPEEGWKKMPPRDGRGRFLKKPLV